MTPTSKPPRLMELFEMLQQAGEKIDSASTQYRESREIAKALAAGEDPELAGAMFYLQPGVGRPPIQLPLPPPELLQQLLDDGSFSLRAAAREGWALAHQAASEALQIIDAAAQQEQIAAEQAEQAAAQDELRAGAAPPTG